MRLKFREDFGFLELALLLALTSLLLQLFPSFSTRLFSTFDPRNWSREAWWRVNIGVLVGLLLLQFGPSIWKEVFAMTSRIMPSSQKPTATKPNRPRFVPRVDPRILLRRDEAERRSRRKRYLVRGLLICGILICMVRIVWLGTAAPDAVAKSEGLYRHHPGRLVNLSGQFGGTFVTGSNSDVAVTHLGIFDSDGDGLHLAHDALLYEVDDSSLDEPKLIGKVRILSGKQCPLIGEYRWTALPKPVVLKTDQEYLLVGDIAPGGADRWPTCESEEGEAAAPEWNPFFVGRGGQSRLIPVSRFSCAVSQPVVSTNRDLTAPWETAKGESGTSISGTIYGVVNLAQFGEIRD